ncbi:ABC transporter ATP-binding protein [Paenibacillus sp. MMO-177]|uniref:ABC transporter ATP-binding protein n=1 Tax=Paenibacillus sp. MMO-177 TaxID=3081289 RepID=UPI00301959AA
MLLEFSIEECVCEVFIVSVNNITKKYAANKGVFDLSFTIGEGEVFGFLGPNGAGKTTTIRHLLGFIRPDSGSATILGQDCWRETKSIQRQLGYLPAEIALPSHMTGTELIQHASRMRGLSSSGKAQALIDRFELDPSIPVKRMSKGMKQKVSIICAFMHDPQVIVLDEPTTGLDPLMQAAFVSLIKEEKAQGKSILMSSHLFEEVEGTCDRIGIIKQGRLVSIAHANEFIRMNRTVYVLTFGNASDYESFQQGPFAITSSDDNRLQLTIEMEEGRINSLIQALASHELVSLRESQASLESHFMAFYH